jgi:hypothetical protein
MAFQTAFMINALSSGEKLIAPSAVVGIEGLYDLPALVKYHADMPVYRQFVAGAFGEDESVWRDESPALANQRLKTLWRTTDLVLLAHSREDGLVEWEQVEAMQRAMETHRPNGELKSAMQVLELTGTHDEVWERGEGVARAIQLTVGYVFTQL